MMWAVNVALAGCLWMLVLATPCCCDPLGGGVGDVEAIARPSRPKSFASPADLRLYLDQLGQYFAVVGRPRFGKRVQPPVPSAPRAAVAAAREPAPYPQMDSDLYDFLQFYQQQQE